MVVEDCRAVAESGAALGEELTSAGTLPGCWRCMWGIAPPATSRDVSEEIAKAVLTAAKVDDRVLTVGTSAFGRNNAKRTPARLADI